MVCFTITITGSSKAYLVSTVVQQWLCRGKHLKKPGNEVDESNILNTPHSAFVLMFVTPKTIGPALTLRLLKSTVVQQWLCRGKHLKKPGNEVDESNILNTPHSAFVLMFVTPKTIGPAPTLKYNILPESLSPISYVRPSVCLFKACEHAIGCSPKDSPLGSLNI
ncbi:hypothetical protein FF38_11174 [Lucilia cuprina]|uniref:Uncharacterized protein n=1 Tax=Lucilia cuprina TaxID=7375 RepID=A0A0L0BVS9_LUCCU|nr:hypothetical protein FF38_11174 [Lucilia cuprina]